MSQLITTYLQDHYAGSSAGADAFERVAGGHADDHVREVVGRLAEQVRADQDSLEKVMERVGAKPSRIKDAAGWLGEKVGRLKPNERLTSRSPLADVLELEALTMAVFGKSLLWKALLVFGDERLDAAELRRLSDRADAQREELERLHLTQAAKLGLS